jgi:hypothetical protein
VDACGYDEDGVWYEIRYTGAGTATSPSRSYSNTPGFGEEQWTANGQFFPEVWALGTIPVVNDNFAGWVAEVGSGDQLQMMIGLGDLTSYTYATVCVTGRAINTTSSSTIDVTNPAVGCGSTVSISNAAPPVDADGVDLGNACLVAGNDFQAVRLDPGVTAGIQSVRITLHGAVW